MDTTAKESLRKNIVSGMAMTQAQCARRAVETMSASRRDLRSRASYVGCMRWWFTLLVISCGGTAPAHDTAVTPKPTRCVSLTATNAQDVYGRVTDESGRPLQGVRVQEMHWERVNGPDWRRSPGAVVTTDRDGTYHLSAARGRMILFQLGGRKVVWANVYAPRRIDLDLDVTKPPGFIAPFDARLREQNPCGEWQCPLSHEPVADWWTRPQPCPKGAKLHFAISGDYSMNGAGVGVQCELDGKPHGAFTAWTIAADGSLDDRSGWFDHGRKCGQWREPPEPEPSAVEPIEPALP